MLVVVKQWLPVHSFNLEGPQLEELVVKQQPHMYASLSGGRLCTTLIRNGYEGVRALLLKVCTSGC